MVAPYSKPCIRGSFLGPGSGDDDRHRRHVLRVGRSPGRPDGFWHLATTVEVETYQLAGATGSLAHAAAFPAAAEGHSGGGTVRQYDNSILHQQGGRHSLSVAVQTSPGLVGLVQSAPDHHIGGASRRGEQCPSGCNYCPTEWTLHRSTFLALWQVWDQPFLDMFASRDWDMIHGYAYPQIALITRVLRKLLWHPSATIVLIASYGPARSGSGR